MTAPDQGGTRRTPEDFRDLKKEIGKAVADIDEIVELMERFGCVAVTVPADSLFNTCREKLQYFADQVKMKVAGKLKRGKFEKVSEEAEINRTIAAAQLHKTTAGEAAEKSTKKKGK